MSENEARIEEVIVEEAEKKKGSKRWMIIPAILVGGAVAIAVAVKHCKAKETGMMEDLEAELYPDSDETGDAPSVVVDVVDSEE